MNKEKCKFHMPELELMGQLLSARGRGPSQAKVEAVTEARQPESATEVRSFLGLMNFCARFIPELATEDSQEKMFISPEEKNKKKRSMN